MITIGLVLLAWIVVAKAMSTTIIEMIKKSFFNMKSSLMMFYKLAKSRYHKKRGQATFLLNPYRRIHTDTIKKLLDDKIIEKIEPNLYIFVILNIGSTMFD